MYKRYILFTYTYHDPEGGLSDVEASFDTLEQVKEYLEEIYKPKTKIVRRKQIHNLQKSTSVEKHTYNTGCDCFDVLDCETRESVLTNWEIPSETKIEVLETIPGWVD